MFSENRTYNVLLVNVHLSQTVNSTYNQLSQTFSNLKCIHVHSRLLKEDYDNDLNLNLKKIDWSLNIYWSTKHLQVQKRGRANKVSTNDHVKENLVNYKSLLMKKKNSVFMFVLLLLFFSTIHAYVNITKLIETH